MANHKNNSGNQMHIPAGKSILDIPKRPPQPIPSAAAKPRNARLTFREMLTEGGVKEYLVVLLKELGTKRKKGPWKEYLEFYVANQSGDVDAMTGPVKAKCEEICKKLNDKYFDEQEM